MHQELHSCTRIDDLQRSPHLGFYVATTPKLVSKFDKSSFFSLFEVSQHIVGRSDHISCVSTSVIATAPLKAKSNIWLALNDKLLIRIIS